MGDSLGPTYRKNLQDLYQFATGLLIQPNINGYVPANNDGINSLVRVSREILRPHGIGELTAPTISKLRLAEQKTKVGTSGPQASNLAKTAIVFDIFKKEVLEAGKYRVVNGRGKLNKVERDRLYRDASKAAVVWLRTKGAFEEWEQKEGQVWKEKYAGGGALDDVEPLSVDPMVVPVSNGGVTPVTVLQQSDILTIERATELAQQDLSDLADEELRDLALTGQGAVRELYRRLQLAKEQEMATPPHGHMLGDLLERKVHTEKSLAVMFDVDDARLQEILNGSVMDTRECQVAAGLLNQSVDFLVRLGACTPCLDSVSEDA